MTRGPARARVPSPAMPHRPRSRSAAAALLLALGAASARAQSPTPLEGKQLAPVARALEGWLAARAQGGDEAAAVAGVRAALRAGREQAGGGDALRFGADLGRALRLARLRGLAGGKPGKVEELESRAGAFAHAPLAWAVRLPRDYDPDDGPWPLLLSLPDEGEEPAQHLRTHWSEAAVRDGAIVVVPRMPAEQAEWTRVSVRGRSGGLCHALTALRLAEERFDVDPDRVWLAGRGKSVPAALAAADAFPQRFAAALGVAGDAGEARPDNLVNVPVLLVGGGARARALVEAARALGIDGIALETGVDPAGQWDWLVAQRRDPWPERVTVSPGDPFPTRAHWLRIAPTAPDARVHGRIVRASNTVVLEGAGFSRATLYLSDALLDLDAPLHVTLGGVTRELAAVRDLDTALDLLADGSADAGAVATFEVVVDADGGDVEAAARALDPEFAARLAAAGDDLALLWELARWCWEHDRVPAGVRTLERMLRLDPEHAEAHQALGHAFGYGRWFPSAWALERFAAGQDEAQARARGYVEYQGLWVHPTDRAALGRGLVKDPFCGQWLGLAETKRLAAGWARQDLAWIEPEQTSNVDLGLWRVDGAWLTLPEAERRRSRVERMWVVPGPEIVLHTTVPRRVTEAARPHAQRALDALRRVFGVEPALPLDVTLLADEEQYDRFAFGSPDGARPPRHVARLHTVHTAFLAESWFETERGKPVYRGMGVGYWDTHAPSGDGYGLHSVRLATGFSYVEAIDPSPKAVRKVARREPGPEYLAAWREEKRLPEWLRLGGAVYAERYFADELVGEGGDRWWARRWSLENLAARGGLGPLDEALACALDPEDRDASLKRMLEAGLLVAFAVDGGCAPVEAAHAELRRALAAGASPTQPAAALEEALRAHEAELRTFASTGG